MIEIVAAVSAASTAFNSIKKGFAMGREIESMAGDLSRWMGAVSDIKKADEYNNCLLYTSPSQRDLSTYRMPSYA